MLLIRFLIVALFAAAPAFAQAPTESTEPKELPAEMALEFEQRIAMVQEHEAALTQLRDRYAQSEGLRALLYDDRINTIWADMFVETVSLAKDLLEQQQNGFDVSSLVEQIVAKLHVFPTDARNALKRFREDVVYPTDEMDPGETAITDQRLLQATRKYDDVLRSMATWLDAAEQLGIENQDVREFLVNEVQDTAANRSTFLHLSLEAVKVLRDAAAALPTDEALSAKLAVNEARVKMASNSLQSAVNIMAQLGLDSSQYSRQLIKTSGELTTELLNFSVLSGIASEWTATTTELAATQGPKVLFRLVVMFLIIVFFIYLGRAAQALTKRALKSSKLTLSALATEMVIAAVKNVVIALGILIALSQIGISLGPLLAGLGIAGFIIGFALQDTLSNFASGMLILFYRPFDVGDFVTAGGVTGKVSHMSLVNTTFKTIDNQVLVVPNNLIWQSVITNVTAQRLRRVDLVFSVAYSDDVEKVERILQEVVDEHELILSEPEPMIKLHELGESSVNFVCRPWVKPSDYWDVYWDLLREIKMRFDKEGITIPFPQRQVHTSGE